MEEDDRGLTAAAVLFDETHARGFKITAKLNDKVAQNVVSQSGNQSREPNSQGRSVSNERIAE
jgi:hypothetical protein